MLIFAKSAHFWSSHICMYPFSTHHNNLEQFQRRCLSRDLRPANIINGFACHRTPTLGTKPKRSCELVSFFRDRESYASLSSSKGCGQIGGPFVFGVCDCVLWPPAAATVWHCYVKLKKKEVELWPFMKHEYKYVALLLVSWESCIMNGSKCSD